MNDMQYFKPWGFWTTTAWGLAAIVAWFATQFAAIFALLAFFGIGPEAAPADIRAIGSQSILIATVSIVSAPAAVAVIALAVRLARGTLVDYLALRMPSGRDLLLGFAFVVVLLPLGDLASHASGREVVPPFVVEAYKSARDSHTLVLLALAFSVAAPVMEEFLFRGFLLPGYATAWFGRLGAVILSSALWAGMHVQYEFFFVAQIFILGLLFGWLRFRSGSTVLTLVLHGFINLSALVETAIVVEWMS